MIDPILQQLMQEQGKRTKTVDPDLARLMRPKTVAGRGIDMIRAEEVYGEATMGAVARQMGRSSMEGLTGVGIQNFNAVNTVNQMLSEEYGIDWFEGVGQQAGIFANSLELWLKDNGITDKDPRFEGDWLADRIPGAMGNLAAQIAVVALTRRLGLPVRASRGVTFGILGAQAGQSAFERALAEGMTRQEAFRQFRWNFAVQGAMETFVADRMFARMAKSEALTRRLLASSMQNALSGAGEVVSADIIAGRDIDFREVGESALLEAIAGGLVDISASGVMRAKQAGSKALANMQGRKMTENLQEMGMTQEEAEDFVFNEMQMPDEAAPNEPLLIENNPVKLTKEQKRRIQLAKESITDPRLHDFTSPNQKLRELAVQAAIELTSNHSAKTLSDIAQDSSILAVGETRIREGQDAELAPIKQDMIIALGQTASQQLVEATTPEKAQEMADALRAISDVITPKAAAMIERMLGDSPNQTSLADALIALRSEVVEVRKRESQKSLKAAIDKAHDAIGSKGEAAKIDPQSVDEVRSILSLIQRKGGEKVREEGFKIAEEMLNGLGSGVPNFTDVQILREASRTPIKDIDPDTAERLSDILTEIVERDQEALAAAKERKKKGEKITAATVKAIEETTMLSPLKKGQKVGRDPEGDGWTKRTVRAMYGKFELSSLNMMTLGLANGDESSDFYQQYYEDAFQAWNDVKAYQHRAEDALMAFAAEELGLSAKDLAAKSETLARDGKVGIILEAMFGEKIEPETVEIDVKKAGSGESHTLKMSKSQVMSIYAHSFDPQIMQRIIQGKNGSKAAIKLNLTEDVEGRSFTLTQDLYDQLTGTLSETEKRLTSFMVNYVNTVNRQDMAVWSTKQYGRDITKSDMYWPLKVDNRTEIEDKDIFNGAWVSATIEGQGIVKDREKFLKNTVIIGDIFTTFAEHQARVGAITQAAETFSLITQALNEPAVQSAFDSKSEGRRALRRLKNDYKMIVNMLVGRATGDSEGVDQLVRMLKRNITVGALAVNPVVSLYQVVSALNAAEHMPVKYLFRALVSKDPEAMNRMQNDTRLRDRSDSAGTAYLTEGTEGDTPPMFARKGLIAKLFSWIRGMDNFAISTIWQASEYFVDDNPQVIEWNDSGDETLEEARDRAVSYLANKIISETQPTTDPFNQSGLASEGRRGNPIASALAQFGSQRLKYANMLMGAMVRNQKNGPKITRAMFSKSMAIILTNSMLLAMIQEMWQWLLGENKDQEAETTLKQGLRRTVRNATGIFPLGSQLSDSLMISADAFYNEWMKRRGEGSSSIFGTSGIQFGSGGITPVDSLFLSLLSDTNEVARELMKEEDSRNLADATADLAVTLGMISGTPIAIPRDLWRMYQAETKQSRGRSRKPSKNNTMRSF